MWDQNVGHEVKVLKILVLVFCHFLNLRIIPGFSTSNDINNLSGNLNDATVETKEQIKRGTGDSYRENNDEKSTKDPNRRPGRHQHWKKRIHKSTYFHFLLLGIILNIQPSNAAIPFDADAEELAGLIEYMKKNGTVEPEIPIQVENTMDGLEDDNTAISSGDLPISENRTFPFGNVNEPHNASRVNSGRNFDLLARNMTMTGISISDDELQNNPLHERRSNEFHINTATADLLSDSPSLHGHLTNNEDNRPSSARNMNTREGMNVLPSEAAPSFDVEADELERHIQNTNRDTSLEPKGSMQVEHAMDVLTGDNITISSLDLSLSEQRTFPSRYSNEPPRGEITIQVEDSMDGLKDENNTVSSVDLPISERRTFPFGYVNEPTQGEISSNASRLYSARTIHQQARNMTMTSMESLTDGISTRSLLCLVDKKEDKKPSSACNMNIHKENYVELRDTQKKFRRTQKKLSHDIRKNTNEQSRKGNTRRDTLDSEAAAKASPNNVEARVTRNIKSNTRQNRQKTKTNQTITSQQNNNVGNTITRRNVPGDTRQNNFGFETNILRQTDALEQRSLLSQNDSVLPDCIEDIEDEDAQSK